LCMDVLVLPVGFICAEDIGVDGTPVLLLGFRQIFVDVVVAHAGVLLPVFQRLLQTVDFHQMAVIFESGVADAKEISHTCKTTDCVVFKGVVHVALSSILFGAVVRKIKDSLFLTHSVF